LRNICFLFGAGRPTQLAAQAKLVKSGPVETLKRTALLSHSLGTKVEQIVAWSDLAKPASKIMHQISRNKILQGFLIFNKDIFVDLI
jgi:hypothetical protein